MIIKAESYKMFSEIYCAIMRAPLELFFGDGCRSVNKTLLFHCTLHRLYHFVAYLMLENRFIIIVVVHIF